MIDNPTILLSVINTRLRDTYESLDLLCEDLDYSKEDVIEKLESIGYKYDTNLNQFIQK